MKFSPHLGSFACVLVAAVAVEAQTIYVPSGTSGIGNNTTNGNVGVGTNAPSFKLDVVNDNYNAIRATGNSTNSVGIFIQNTVSSGRQWALVSSGGGPLPVGNFAIWDDTAGAARLSINSAGDFGIGTGSPQALFHIAGNNTKRVLLDNGIILSQKNAGGTIHNLLTHYNDDNVYLDNPDGHILFRAGATTSEFIFQTGYGEKMRINAAGNVGIGTATPAYPLHIVSGSPRLLLEAVGSGGTAGVFAKTANGVGTLRMDEAGSWVVFNGASAAAESEKLRVTADGNVGIGTTSPSHKLAVNGTIRAHEVIVDTGWSDYVFADDYRLAPLAEVESHIKAERHLPGIPSAQEVAERGVTVGEMQAKLLAKIEELTLHQIAQEKRHAALENRIAAQQAEIAALRALVGPSSEKN